MLGARLFAVGDVDSTGAEQTGDHALVRYPTSFLGIGQCVTATRSAQGVEVATHSGVYCDTFLG